MISARFIFGLIVGGLITFYALPYYERNFGVINRPGFSQIKAINLSDLIENKERTEDITIQLKKSVYLAIELARSVGLDGRASRHTISVLNDITEHSPSMREMVAKTLSTTKVLTNEKAIEIFNAFLEGGIDG